MEHILFERNINNLYDNGRTSFKKLKEVMSNVNSLNLEKKQIPKGKKILLSFSAKQGKLSLADNKTEIKDGGKDINQYLKSCDTLKEEIGFALNNLEKNINSMDQEEQESIFGPENNVYYNTEILLKPDNCLNYNSKHFNILPDGHGEYDKNGKLIIAEVSRQTSKLNELLNKWHNSLKHEKYNLEDSAIRNLKKLSEKDFYNYACNKLDNSLSAINSYINNDNFSLNDESTIEDYMLLRVYVLLNGLLEKSNTGIIDPLAKMNIAKRLLGIKGIGMQDITKKLEPEQEKFIKQNILNDRNKKDLLKNAIKPIEDVIINYCFDILKSIKAILLLNNVPSYKRLNKQIDNSINFINTSNGISSLKNELKNLKYIDKYFNKNNLSYYYDGELLQPVGNFSPINEMLKIFKPFNELETDKKIIDETNFFNLVNETIKKRGNKYCLLSKKTKKNLGCYNSKKDAIKREKQVQYFKNVKEDTSVGSGAVQGSIKKQ